MVFFSLPGLAKFTVKSCKVVVAFCYITMVLTINLFSNDQSHLVVLFSFMVLAKVTVNNSQAIVVVVLEYAVFSFARTFSAASRPPWESLSK